MYKEEMNSRICKEDERKIFIDRQVFVNIVYTLLFIFILFSFFKYVLNKDFLDLNTVMVFLCPAWTAFLATKYYYHRKAVTFIFALLFFVLSVLSIVDFFVDVFPLNIF